MQNSWLNKILSSILVCFIAVACRQIPHMKRVDTAAPAAFKSPYFQNGDSLYMFKTNVDTYGKSLGGILILKSTNKDTLKATFVSQMGFKFFDLEIYKDSFTVKEVIPQLNIKGVLKTLQDDIRQMVLWDHAQFQKLQYLTSKSDPATIIQYEDQKDLLYIYRDAADHVVKSQKVINHSRKLKNEILYSKHQNGRAQQLSIKHFKFKLLITLEVLP